MYIRKQELLSSMIKKVCDVIDNHEELTRKYQK